MEKQRGLLAASPRRGKGRVRSRPEAAEEAVNKITGRNVINRGFSALQTAILGVLPTGAGKDRCILVAEIFKRLGVDRPTNAQRAALSRCLSRLAERGIVARWRSERAMQGDGSGWSLP
jgi:hypothetical protein